MTAETIQAVKIRAYCATPKPEELLLLNMRTIIETTADPRERKRCQAALIDLQNRIRDRERRETDDKRGLQYPPRDPRRLIPERYQITIDLLRAYAIPSVSAASAELSKIDRSGAAMTAPERFAQSARRGQWAKARFFEGAESVAGSAIAEQAWEMIVHERKLKDCCVAMGYSSRSPKVHARIKDAAIEGLKEASVYLGC